MAAIKVITDCERVGKQATRIVPTARSMQERGVVSISHHEAVQVIACLAGAQLQDFRDLTLVQPVCRQRSMPAVR